MAETKAVADENKGTSPRVEIDSLSKEDLIKQIKKQVILLQKSKTKCDDLRKQCTELERQLNQERGLRESNNEVKNVLLELDEVSAEKDELKIKLESLQKEFHQIVSKYKEGNEQIDCMKMKEDSMKSAMKCLQEELNRINDQNEELRSQMNELIATKEESRMEYSTMLKKLETLQQELDYSKTSQDKLLVDQQTAIEKLELHNESLEGKLEKMKQKCLTLQDKLEHLNRINEDLEKQKSHVEELVRSQSEELDKDKNFQTEIFLRLQNFKSDEKETSEDCILSIIENLLEDREQLQQKWEESQSYVVSLQMEMDGIHQLNNESLVKELENKIEKIQDSYCVLEAELHNMTVERDKLLFQEERENSDCYEEQIKDLVIENEDLRMKLEHSEFEVAELQSKFEDNDAPNEQFENKQELLSQFVQTENFTNNALANNDRKQSSTQTSLLKEFQDLSDLETKLLSLQKENNLLREELESLGSLKIHGETDSEDSKQNLVIKILESENSVLQNEIADMKNKEIKYKIWLKDILNCSETALDLWENDGENISLEINNFKNYIEILQLENQGITPNSNDDVCKQLQTAQVELEKCKEMINQLELQIKNYTSEIEIVHKEKQLLKEEADCNIVELTKLKQLTEELDMKLRDKTEELEYMEMSLKESSQDSDRCFQDLQTANELKMELETEIQNLIVQLQHYKTESDKLKLLTKETNNKDKLFLQDTTALSSNDEFNNLETVTSESNLESNTSLTQTDSKDNGCFVNQNLEKQMIKLLDEPKTNLILEKESDQEQQLNEVTEEKNQSNQENAEMIIQRLKQELKELNVQFSNVKKENEAILLELNQNNKILVDKNQEIEKLNNDCQILLKKLELLQSCEIKKTDVSSQSEGNGSTVINNSPTVEESNVELEDAERIAQFKETEDRLQKYKAIAIKTKKELAENKQQVLALQLHVDKVIQEKQQLEDEIIQWKENLKATKTDLNELKCNYEESVSDITKYKMDLDKTIFDLASTRAQFVDSKAQNDVLSSQIEVLKQERKKHEALIVASTEEKEKVVSQLENLSSDVKQAKETQKRLAIELKQERERHQQTSQRLTDSERETNQLRVMKLEMADCERLVTNLNVQLSEAQKRIEILQTDAEQKQELIVTLQKQIEQSEEQLKQAEERGSKLKSLLEKSKKELNDLRIQENECKATKAQLMSELETVKQEKEAIKMMSANLMGETQKLQEIIRSMKENQQRAVNALELKISSLQEDYDRLNTVYKVCQSEYEGYKVRVHSVLKQQKNKSVPNSTNLDQLEKERLEQINEQLKLRVQEMSDQLAAVTLEYEALQEEYDRLLARHNNLHQDLQKREEDWKEMYDQLTEENTAYKNESAELIQQLQEQNNSIAETFKVQLHKQQAEFDRNLENIQRQLNFAEAEVTRLQKDQMKATPVRDDDVFDVINTERQEGEGSESTDPLPGMPNKFGGVISEILPFEQLLTQDEKLSDTTISFHEYENVQSQIISCNKKIEHLSEVLNESEASNMRLVEQVRVLKEEIRRLERNQQREEHAANMEYLKNVILKFLLLQGGDERERLVPVLTMMLRLSPTETSQLNTIAKGGEVESEAAAASGWGTYLPRWSGLV